MRFFEEHKELGTLILRTFLGVAFLVAGLDKILGLSIVTGMFQSIFGVTAGAPLLYLAIVIELAGGLTLLFNWHARESALVLSVLMAVALVSTFKLGAAPHFIGILRELIVMNTGGANTAVNLAYLAGLLSLAFNECKQCS